MRINNDNIPELDDANQQPMDDAADTVDAVWQARATADGTSGVVLSIVEDDEEDPYEYI